jgi:hypothetical protein
MIIIIIIIIINMLILVLQIDNFTHLRLHLVVLTDCGILAQKLASLMGRVVLPLGG